MTERDLRQFAVNLRKNADSIWVGTGHAELSYPDDGNAACFQVEDESFWFRHRNRCIVALVRMFRPDGVLFDVGGGNGFVTAGLLAAGVDTILVEPGPVGARNARNRGIPDVICTTVEDAGFIPGSVPAVGMFDVLEHIEDDIGFLRTLKHILKPGGRIYIAVPAFPSLWSKEDESAGHFRRYTLASLSRTMTAAGFVVEHETYAFQSLWLPVMLFRSLPTRLHLRGELAERGRRVQRDHAGPQGRIWNALLDREHNAICAGRRIAFGSSCMIVAHA